MPLKLRHLEVFNALIEAGSVSRAAERLNLTQPAVSIALSNLEADLGFRLFHRDRGFFAPTSEAMQLHSEVAQSLLAVSRVEQRATEIRSGATGGVSIATNGALAINFLPGLIADFQRDHPGINVELRVHSSRQISSWVSGRQIDIGLIDTPVPAPGLKADMYRLECVCIMREDDPLASEKVIRPQALQGRSVIAVTGDHGVDRQLNRLLARAEVNVGRNISSYYFAIARNIVAAGDSLALIDPINGKAQLNDNVIWRPFAPRVDHELAVITARHQSPGHAVTAFLDRIRTGLKAAQAPGKERYHS